MRDQQEQKMLKKAVTGKETGENGEDAKAVLDLCGCDIVPADCYNDLFRISKTEFSCR